MEGAPLSEEWTFPTPTNRKADSWLKNVWNHRLREQEGISEVALVSASMLQMRKPRPREEVPPDQ